MLGSNTGTLIVPAVNMRAVEIVLLGKFSRNEPNLTISILWVHLVWESIILTLPASSICITGYEHFFGIVPVRPGRSCWRYRWNSTFDDSSIGMLSVEKYPQSNLNVKSYHIPRI
jgi:hypothetical protein